MNNLKSSDLFKNPIKWDYHIFGNRFLLNHVLRYVIPTTPIWHTPSNWGFPLLSFNRKMMIYSIIVCSVHFFLVNQVIPNSLTNVGDVKNILSMWNEAFHTTSREVSHDTLVVIRKNWFIVLFQYLCSNYSYNIFFGRLLIGNI